MEERGMYEVSVIVPVYNVEQWLPRCLKSLVNQTIFNDIEILLIDDGSTDLSGSLCDSYASKYKNIVTYHKSNGGVSSARNYGLQYANGLYVAFVDSDDYVGKEFYELMIKSGKKQKADLLVGDYNLVFPDGKKKRYRSSVNKSISWSQDSAIKDFLKGKDIGVNLFDKLFLRDTVGDLKFDEEIKIGEDMYFIFQFLTRAKKVYGSFIPGYYYFQREGSTMNSSFTESHFDVITISKRILEWINGNRPELLRYAEAMYVHSAYKTIERAYKFNVKDVYNKRLEFLIQKINSFPIYTAWECLSRKQFVGFVLMRMSPKLYVKVCRFMKI